MFQTPPETHQKSFLCTNGGGCSNPCSLQVTNVSQANTILPILTAIQIASTRTLSLGLWMPARPSLPNPPSLPTEHSLHSSPLSVLKLQHARHCCTIFSLQSYTASLDQFAKTTLLVTSIFYKFSNDTTYLHSGELGNGPSWRCSLPQLIMGRAKDFLVNRSSEETHQCLKSSSFVIMQ